VQAVGALHDTALNPVLIDRPGPGMTCARQVVPFHRSASPTVVLRPPLWPAAPAALMVTEPAAVQAPVAVQDTASNSLPVAPAGLGVAWMRQLVPFHRSASITEEPVLVP